MSAGLENIPPMSTADAIRVVKAWEHEAYVEFDEIRGARPDWPTTEAGTAHYRRCIQLANNRRKLERAEQEERCAG